MILYLREGCHLCEDMLADLRLFQDELDFTLTLTDIDTDPALQKQYHALVPVLAGAQGMICNYYLDLVALRQALAAE